jgi:hypothetical protein
MTQHRAWQRHCKKGWSKEALVSPSLTLLAEPSKNGLLLLYFGMKIAIWARVSSQEQDASTQLEPLRTLAAQLGGEIVYEYVLNESAEGQAWQAE